MRLFTWKMYPLLFLLAGIDASGVGKAWRVLPSKTETWSHPSWPRLDSSAFEVRTVSGVGRLDPFDGVQKSSTILDRTSAKPNALPAEEHRVESRNFENYDRLDENLFYDPEENVDDMDDLGMAERIMKTGIRMTVLPNDSLEEVVDDTKEATSRVRRDAENETKMEKISTTKSVRDVRQNSPESWSTQPLSVEFRHRTSLDQMIQEDEDPMNLRHHVPRADFITGHRRSYENREPREMPVTRRYEDYDVPWYRNAIREREYEAPTYRRYNYYYPERYRTERDYFMRVPNEQSYYYDRYRDDDFDLYGRSRPTPKPKRIIYYATLPEIVRKPVDLRNYPRSYDTARTPVSRDGGYKRVPGNVDPSRYRYRNLYDGYDSYSKRSSFVDRPVYTYPEEERRKIPLTENLRNDAFDQERKPANQITTRDDGKLPWPVQIGTEVSVKEDERIPGRKIFGENNGYERFQNAQLQKAPDATGSSELRSDN